MKKIKRITGITLMAMTLAVPAFAWGGPGMGRGGMGTGSGPGYSRNWENCRNNLTKEQQERLYDLHKQFRDKTADTRTELIKKEVDLRAELNRDNPDIKKAEAIQKDINGLRAKISDAHLEFIVAAKKIAPDMPFGMGRGMRGLGMRGMRGGGMQRGMMN